VLQALKNFTDLFRHVETELRASGRYFERNRGVFSYGLENIDFVEDVGLPRTQRVVLEKTGEIFNGVRRRSLELLGEDAGGDLPLTRMMTPNPIF